MAVVVARDCVRGAASVDTFARMRGVGDARPRPTTEREAARAWGRGGRAGAGCGEGGGVVQAWGWGRRPGAGGCTAHGGADTGLCRGGGTGDGGDLCLGTEDLATCWCSVVGVSWLHSAPLRRPWRSDDKMLRTMPVISYSTHQVLLSQSAPAGPAPRPRRQAQPPRSSARTCPPCPPPRSPSHPPSSVPA